MRCSRLTYNGSKTLKRRKSMKSASAPKKTLRPTKIFEFDKKKFFYDLSVLVDIGLGSETLNLGCKTFGSLTST